MPEEITFSTRAEMTAGFTEALRRHTERYEEERRSNYGEGWIKSQILESDVHTNNISAQIELGQKLDAIVGRTQSMTIRALPDDSFYLLQYRKGSESGNFYLDGSDPRFIALYTKAKSTIFTQLINKLTENESLDHAWFPDEVLYDFKTLGYFRGYGGNFTNRFFLNREQDEADTALEDDDRFRDVSSKSRGNTERLLNLIREDDQLKNEFALTSLRIKKQMPESREDAAIDDITFAGKFTTVGKSFVAHTRLIREILERYRYLVTETVEAKYGLKYEGGLVVGEKLRIKFPHVESDIYDFSKRLFSGKKPFMLWGLPEKVSDDFVRVHAVDLHIGKTLSFEISPDQMTVLLPDGVCGNTIMRLITLLQQNYGSQISAEASNGDKVLTRLRQNE